MNLEMVLMEIKRLRKTLIIALLAPAGYSALIMVFYIAFAGVFQDLQGLFDNASLQGLLRAFSMDNNTFLYILNYYVSYNSVYMLIMGIVFAAALSVKLFSAELKNGTYEFSYANPISRVKIFFSKAVVVVLYLLVLNILVFLVGFLSLEMLKTKSPLIPWMSEENIELLNEKIEEVPERISMFDRSDALFYELMYQSIENQFGDIEKQTVDDELVSDLLSIFLLNPDKLFDTLIASPEKYMALYNMKPGQEEAYVALLNTQKTEYLNIKNGFQTEDVITIGFFENSPESFLNQVVDNNQEDHMKQVFDLSEKEYKSLFVYYSFKNYFKLSVTTFLAMLSIAMFIMMLIIVIPGGKMTSGMASGVAFIFYFANMMGNIAEPVRFLKYISPLSYINMDVMNVHYQTDSWSWIVMLCIITISFIVALLTIRKSDLISS